MAFRDPVLGDFPSNRFVWLDRPDKASLAEWQQFIDFLNALDDGSGGGGVPAGALLMQTGEPFLLQTGEYLEI